MTAPAFVERRERVVFGSFVCANGPGPYDSGRGYTVEMSAKDFKLGNARTVTSVIEGILADGAAVQMQGFANSEDTTFGLTFTGTGPALARAEADLARELHRRNTLTWQPPDPDAEVCVFDVEHSVIDRTPVKGAPWEYAETYWGQRSWLITLTCLPLVRADELSEVVSTAVAEPVRDTVDACDSAAGWSGSPREVVQIDGRTALKIGPVQPYFHNPGHRRPWQASPRPTKTFNLTQLFLSIDVRSVEYDMVLDAGASGGQRRSVMTETLFDGWRRFYFSVENIQGNRALSFVQYHESEQPEPFTIHIDNIQQMQALPAQSTKTLLGKIVNEGSQRAPATLVVERPDAAMGNVLVFTAEDDGRGFTPGMRRFRAGGASNPFADPARISGAAEALGAGANTFRARVPQRMLAERAYEVYLVVLPPASTSGTVTPPVVTISSTTFAEGIKLEPAQLNGFFALAGQVLLPQVPSPPESEAWLTLWVSNGGGGQWGLDEVLLVPQSKSERERNLTIVSGAARYLFSVTPSPDLPRGALWSGDAADRSDALSIAHRALPRGQHYVPKGGGIVYVAASGATAPPVVTTRYYRTATHHIAARDTGQDTPQ